MNLMREKMSDGEIRRVPDVAFHTCRADRGPRTEIHSTLRGYSSELRRSYQKVSPEMNVSRRVDNPRYQDHLLTPSELRATVVQKQQQNR